MQAQRFVPINSDFNEFCSSSTRVENGDELLPLDSDRIPRTGGGISTHTFDTQSLYRIVCILLDCVNTHKSYFNLSFIHIMAIDRSRVSFKYNDVMTLPRSVRSLYFDGVTYCDNLRVGCCPVFAALQIFQLFFFLSTFIGKLLSYYCPI